MEKLVETKTISSLEVAYMLGIEHSKIIRKLEGSKDRKGFIEILADAQMGFTDYFIKSSYFTEQNKEMPCYEFTKLGCDFIANKFTGEKGIIFTAKYVKRFDDMEHYIKDNVEPQTLIGYNSEMQHVKQRVEKLENTMTIDYGQQEELRTIGNIIVVEALGGYESNAYKEIGKKVFCSLWKDYKRYFKINSYKNTPRARYIEAQRYVSNWQPDTNTSIRIRQLNSYKQQSLEVGALA